MIMHKQRKLIIILLLGNILPIALLTSLYVSGKISAKNLFLIIILCLTIDLFVFIREVSIAKNIEKWNKHNITRTMNIISYISTPFSLLVFVFVSLMVVLIPYALKKNDIFGPFLLTIMAVAGSIIVLKHSKLFPWASPTIKVDHNGIETNRWKISWDEIKDIDGWDNFINKGRVPLILKINTIRSSDFYIKAGTYDLLSIIKLGEPRSKRFYLVTSIRNNSPHPAYIFIMINKLLALMKLGN